jgi:hypothetical protein
MRILDVSTAAKSLSFCSDLHQIERPTQDRQNPDLVRVGWSDPCDLDGPQPSGFDLIPALAISSECERIFSSCPKMTTSDCGKLLGKTL